MSVKQPTMMGIAFISVIKSLMANEYMACELAELTGLQPNTVGKYLHMLHRANLVYVCGFGVDSRGYQHPRFKKWRWGTAADAKYVNPSRHARYLREKRKTQARRERAAQVKLNLLTAAQA